VVTEIGWEGSMRRKALDTWYLTEAGRWDDLIEQVLAAPPPYRADPGHPVYVIHAGDRAVLIGEQDLTGPLADLVTTVLETGGPPLSEPAPFWPRTGPTPGQSPCHAPSPPVREAQLGTMPPSARA